nr:Gag-Pol polyprotein [Tanacetum cinerariifolium]
SKLGFQCMTSGQISSGLDLTYAPSTITTQQPTEGVYVCQPEGFIDVDHPSHVFKLNKALYGLKQTPRAWYDELSTFLLQNHFFKGTTDPTLFIRRFVDDILVSDYVLKILKKYEMKSCDPVGTPMEIKDKLDLDQNGTPVDATKYRTMIGALMYLTSSRPDILHATCLCARFLDVDYARCKDTFKSTFGGAQFLGEKLVSWSSKKQDCTTLSTAKAEYVSLSACCPQVLWMRTQLTNYGFHFNKIPIYCDSKSAIAISCNPVQHSRTKHIVVRYHFIKEHVEKGTIELYFVKTDYQLADLFTKALPADHFNYLVRRLGMRSLSPQELDRLAKSHRSQRDLPRNTTLDRVEVLASFESRPPMFNKENYVPWSSCLLRYAKSRPNGKLIHNSILYGPYVRKMIPEPGDANREITVTETFHLQTDDELSDKELKQIEADDQAIQTILLGLHEDIYAAIDSCETAHETLL